MTTCQVTDCQNPIKTRGWCVMHYSRWLRHGDPLVTKRDRRPASEKIPDRVVVDSNGCHLWTGCTSQAGYGYVSDRGHVVLVHRFTWEQANGLIPQGMEVDHLCFVRNCLNIAHLDLVTPTENKRRMIERKIADRPNCPQGHPYSGDNLRIESDGHRRCQICRSAQGATRNERRRAS